MGPRPKLAAAAALAALAALVWYTQRDDAPRPDAPAAPAAALAPPDAPAPTATGAPAPGPRAAGAGSDADAREALAEPAALSADPRPLPPHRFELAVRALDDEDRPLAGARVFVAPRGGAWNRAGTTDARGAYTLALRGARPTLEVDVLVRAPFGSGGACRALALSAGAPQALAVGLPRGHAITLRLVPSGSNDGSYTFDARPAAGAGFATDAAPELGALADGSACFVDPGAPAGPLPAGPDAAAAALGAALGEVTLIDPLQGGMLSVSGDGGGAIQLLLEGALEIGPPPSPSGSRPAEPLPEELLPEELPRARGAVLGGDGSPLAGVRVEARAADGSLVTSARTDEQGQYALRLEAAVDGALTLRAGGGQRGRTQTEWRPDVEPELRWDAWLDRGHELRGRLLDPEGAPLAGWRVEVEAADPREPLWDHTRTDEAGRFAIPNLPRRALRVLLRPGDAQRDLARAVVDDVWPDGPEREFALTPAALAAGAIALEVADAAGAPAAGLELRAVQLATGRAAPLRPEGGPGRYALDGLPAGEYRVVGAAPEAPIAFRLEAGERLDLGRATLPAPALLALAFPDAGAAAEAGADGADGAVDGAPPAFALELWREEAGHVVRAAALAAPPHEPLLLPPGAYELELRRGLRSARERFVLAPGERAERALRLAPED